MFRSRKLLKYIVGLFVLAVTALMFYTLFMINENDKIRVDLKQELQKNKYVDFSKTVESDWDNLILVAPYTSKSELKEKYGISANRIKDFSIEYRDDRVLLLFCKGQSLKEYVYWRGSILTGEDQKLYGTLKIKRENAKWKAGKPSDENEAVPLILVKDS